MNVMTGSNLESSPSDVTSGDVTRGNAAAGNVAWTLCEPFAFQTVIDDICDLPWATLDSGEVLLLAKAYYYFSVQFRENLEIACRLYPHDPKLMELHEGECATDNLSPFPGVSAEGEKMDHDEFMRRLLALEGADGTDYVSRVGETYLKRVRGLDDNARAASIVSYEDGGLSRVFHAMLCAPEWHGSGAQAFRFFLEEHIRFDSDDDGGHGALSRHLPVNDAILPLWVAFRELLVAALPRFWQTGAPASRTASAPMVAIAAE